MIHKIHYMESLNRITYWQYDSRWIVFLSATTCCYSFCKCCYVSVHHCINIYNAFKILEFIKILRRLWYKLLNNHLNVHIKYLLKILVSKHYFEQLLNNALWLQWCSKFVSMPSSSKEQKESLHENFALWRTYFRVCLRMM